MDITKMISELRAERENIEQQLSRWSELPGVAESAEEDRRNG